MPRQDHQLSSGSWHNEIVANRDYAKDEPLDQTLANWSQSKGQVVGDIMLQVKGMLNEARISTGPDCSVEISHHYGLDRFREFGAVIVDCVNREYCKKLLVVLPRQKHPYHYHKRKEETFQLLHGDLEIEANGAARKLNPGDTFLVLPETWHKFHSLDGAIVEEISTTHYKNDSIYEDEVINQLALSERKTKIPNL
jgi:N-acetylneuraminate synthase